MSQSPNITYTGRVIDQRRQAPISGARVSFRAEEISIFTYSDIEGIYRLVINSTNTDTLRGELTIEAEGYRNYQSVIHLSSQQTELEDIRLLGLNEMSSNFFSGLSGDNSNLFPIVIVAAVALFTVAIIILNSAPRRNPEYRRDELPRYFQSYEQAIYKSKVKNQKSKV